MVIQGKSSRQLRSFAGVATWVCRTCPFSGLSRETGNWNDDIKKSDYTQMQLKRRGRKSETFIKDIPVSIT